MESKMRIGGPKVEQTIIDVVVDAYFEDAMLRCDVRQTAPRRTSASDNDQAFHQKAIILPDSAIVQTSKSPMSGLRFGVRWYKYDMSREAKIKKLSKGFDPRLLGLFPGSLLDLNSFDFTSIVGGERRRKTFEKNKAINGAAAKVVEYVRDDDWIASMWFIDGDARRLVRTQLSGTYGGKQVEDRIESEFGDLTDENVFYPNHLVYTRTVDNEVVERDVVKVTTLEFNKEIPQKVFTLAGLDLVPGTQIHQFPSDGPTMKWTGSELTPIGSMPLTDIEKSDVGSSMRPYFIFGNLMVAVMLFAVYIRRLRNQSMSSQR